MFEHWLTGRVTTQEGTFHAWCKTAHTAPVQSPGRRPRLIVGKQLKVERKRWSRR